MRTNYLLLLPFILLAGPASATTGDASGPTGEAERGADLLTEDMNVLVIRLSETRDPGERRTLQYQLAYTLHALHRQLQYIQAGSRDQQITLSCAVFAALPPAVSAHVGGPDPSHVCRNVSVDRRAVADLGFSVKAPVWRILKWVR